MTSKISINEFRKIIKYQYSILIKCRTLNFLISSKYIIFFMIVCAAPYIIIGRYFWAINLLVVRNRTCIFTEINIDSFTLSFLFILINKITNLFNWCYWTTTHWYSLFSSILLDTFKLFDLICFLITY